MQNPFRYTVADAWGEPADVQSLHAAASDDLVRRIDELSATSKAGGAPGRSQCVLLLGPAGSGKTHLFARLRRKLGHRAVFFHTRPELGAVATPRYLLAQLVDALRQYVLGSEHTQLDLIAGAMISSALGQSTKYSLTLVAEPPDDPAVLVERAISAAERRYPRLLPKYLSRLLTAAFEAEPQTRRAAYSWLSGRPPGESELGRLGETAGLGNEDILPALRTLGFAATFGAPLVLVFDQLENLADDDPTRARMLAHAQLVTELSDTVPGTLIVQMALDSEWTRFIRPALPQQLRHRIEETVVPLGFPTEEQARQLIEIHLEQIPPEERKGPFPWPLDPEAVERWTRETLTPRALLTRCKSAMDDFLAGRAPPEEARPEDRAARLEERLESLFHGFLHKAREEVDRAARDGHYLDAERIASGLLAVLPLTSRPARRASGKKDRPDIRLPIEPPALVLIAQQNHHRSLAALFAEALETSEERVIVLREHAFPIPPTWKQVHEQLAMLQARKNIRYVTVPREELVEWLAAESMLSAARSKDLSDDQGRSIEHERVVEWLRRRWEKRRSSFLDTLMVSAGEAPAGEAPVPDKPAASEKQRRPPARPAAPPKVSSPEPDPTGEPEDIALEKLVVSQLLKLGVSASVARRHVGARLIRLEVTAPRQRVADLDRAAADVEHKLSEREVSFEREGPRRFFTAPRREPRPVLLSDLLRKEDAWLRERPGRFVLGERVDGETVKGDLADGGSCHLLVAGQTGSGKSVLLRALLLGLAKWHSPERIRFTLGDPKRVTFGALADTLAAHLRRPVCYNAEAIVLGLEKLAEEMDARYSIFQKGHFQDVLEHNASRSQKLPLEVVILDEFADLVLDKAYKQAFLDSVKRIGNMGRAAGIHMILATQRPDRSSIPGEIKANLVGKVALKVQSSLNSRIILGEGGAEKLLGKGDFLADLGHGILRAQAPVVETPS